MDIQYLPTLIVQPSGTDTGKCYQDNLYTRLSLLPFCCHFWSLSDTFLIHFQTSGASQWCLIVTRIHIYTCSPYLTFLQVSVQITSSNNTTLSKKNISLQKFPPHFLLQFFCTSLGLYKVCSSIHASKKAHLTHIVAMFRMCSNSILHTKAIDNAKRKFKSVLFAGKTYKQSIYIFLAHWESLV